MAKSSSKNEVFENSLCSKDCKKNTDSLNSKITDLTDKLFDANNLISHYKLALTQVESRLIEFKEREVNYCEKIRTLEFYNESNNECIEILKKLKTLKQEKEGVDGKLAGLLTASKDLDNLIESQRADKNKEGLGYIVVPPPLAQRYSSPKKDFKRVKRGTARSHNNTYKSPTHRPVVHRPHGPPMRPMRSNMNGACPNITSFNKQAHSYTKRPFQETTQDLMIILIQRVQRLERELKARAHIHNVDKVRSRPVMAWVLKKD
nr:hypothetical protein [Tanacetum cinerariifolium]